MVLVGEVEGAAGGGEVDREAESEGEWVPDVEGVGVVVEVRDDERVGDGAMGAARQNRCAVFWKLFRKSCSPM